MTKYEKIISASIEEMAVTIMCPNEIGMAEIECDKSDECNCCQCCYEWLQEEKSTKSTVVEYCNHCEYENELQWDVKANGWQIHCANCGEKLMLCDECTHSEDNPTMACPDKCLREESE